MSTTYTPNLSLPVYDEGDNPGAGSKTATTGGGLNQQMTILDNAVGVGHTAAGAHRDDVIDGNSLKSTVADGSTLETSAGTGAKTIRIKDLGVTSGKLASGAVVAGKIANGAIDASAQIVDGVVSTGKIADSGVTTIKINDDAVTAGKISHDNNRTKNMFLFAVPSGNTSPSFGGVTWPYGSTGFVAPRAGCIMKVTVCDQGGSTESKSQSYRASGTNAEGRFAAGDKLTWYRNTSTGGNYPVITGNPVNSAGLDTVTIVGSTDDLLVVLEVEFDD